MFLQDHNNCSALVLACSGGHTAVCSLLLAAGASISHTTNRGGTALMVASLCGHAACVRAIVKVAAPKDVNQCSSQGFTSLTLSCQEGHADCVKALLTAAAGVDLHSTAVRGGTALMMAAYRGHEACVRALLSSAAARHDVGGWQHIKGDASRCTALMAACKKGHHAIAAMLLTAGSCRFQIDNTGSTALSWAENSKVVKVFLRGVDYWTRQQHGSHLRCMQDAVHAVFLTRQRLDAHVGKALGTLRLPRTLPHVPEEIWHLVCSFLRSADFARSHASREGRPEYTPFNFVNCLPKLL